MFLNTTYQEVEYFQYTNDLGNDLSRVTSDGLFWLPPTCTTSDNPRILGGRCWDNEDPSVATSSILDRNDRQFDHDRDVSMCQEDSVGVVSLISTDQPQVKTWSTQTLCFPVGRNPSPFAFKNNEMYLLNYFVYDISPRCTTWPMDNPFAQAIMPVCISALDTPIFNIVVAVSSHQLTLLNDSRFENDTWIYRGKALRSFQTEISQVQSQKESSVAWDQVISTLVMLAFFDVSSTVLDI